MSDIEEMNNQDPLDEQTSQEPVMEETNTEELDSLENPCEEVASEDIIPAKPEKKALSKPQQLWKDVRDILVILAAFMLVYVLFFRVVVVVGDSMNNTLVDGDRLLLISNLFYGKPQQGDVIVASKDSFRGGECIIKRVIATEGQTVDIDFKTGSVYVDGVLLEEVYLSSPTLSNEGITFPLTVSEGCIFVMGDNRMDSLDSRSPQIGLIEEREILGKAIFILFPGTDDGTVPLQLDRIGVIG